MCRTLTLSASLSLRRWAISVGEQALVGQLGVAVEDLDRDAAGRLIADLLLTAQHAGELALAEARRAPTGRRDCGSYEARRNQSCGDGLAADRGLGQEGATGWGCGAAGAAEGSVGCDMSVDSGDADTGEVRAAQLGFVDLQDHEVAGRGREADLEADAALDAGIVRWSLRRRRRARVAHDGRDGR